MTQNQIKYWELQETIRQNLMAEALREKELAESERHNKASETISSANLNETRRANVARESENVRHNTAVENLNSADLVLRTTQQQETARHNQASESTEYLKAQAQALSAENNVTTATLASNLLKTVTGENTFSSAVQSAYRRTKNVEHAVNYTIGNTASTLSDRLLQSLNPVNNVRTAWNTTKGILHTISDAVTNKKTPKPPVGSQYPKMSGIYEIDV